jgi:hypothetical protein
VNELRQTLKSAIRVGLGGPKRPRLPTGLGPGTGHIYYVAGDTNVPTGGVRVMYQHVDQLNALGFHASVLHQRSGSRCTWFDNSTSVRSVRETSIGATDLIVASELDVDILASFTQAPRHVIFNQSGHLTWKRGVQLTHRYYSSAANLHGILTVSEHSTELLNYAFPNMPIATIPNVVEKCNAQSAKGNVIAFASRRGKNDAQLVMGLLSEHPAMVGWSFQALHDLSAVEFMAALSKAKIFLSTSYQEGFGLPAAEAMSAGCYVVGFHGFGGREFMRQDFSASVETGDVLACARALEEAVSREARSPGWCESRGTVAARFVRENYSLERQQRALNDFFGRIPGLGRDEAVGKVT